MGCLKAFKLLYLSCFSLRGAGERVKPLFISLLMEMSSCSSLQTIVTIFACSLMGELRKVISDQMSVQRKTATDTRSLLDFAAEIQPFRKQLNMPLFRKPVMVGNNLAISPKNMADDLNMVLMSHSISNHGNMVAMHRTRTLSASSLKHRLSALTNSYSLANSKADSAQYSTTRGG